MGCASSSASNPGGEVGAALCFRPDPEVREVDLKDGDARMQVGFVSPSLAYCLLVAHPEDSTVFLDTRARTTFDNLHVHGAWCLAEARAGGSNSAAPDAEGNTQSTAWLDALRARCTLRSVIVYGDETKASTDEGVLSMLRSLRRSGARPKGAPMVLKTGVRNFVERFPFCLCKRGEERTRPLPPSPAEVLAPGWSGSPTSKAKAKPPALYLGTDRCLNGGGGAGNERAASGVLRCLGVKHVIRIATGDGGFTPPSGSRLKFTTVKASLPKDPLTSGCTDVDAARRACDILGRQASPCLVVGHAGAVAVALFLVDALPGSAGSVDEVMAIVKGRFPSAEFDATAQAAITGLLAKRGRAAPNAETSAPVLEQVSPPPQPVAPPPHGGRVSGSRDTAGDNGAPNDHPPSYVSKLCKRLRDRNPTAAEVSLETLRRILNHILEDPAEPKFRRLKASNERVKKEVLSHGEVVEMLRLVGFVRDDNGDFVLPPATPLQGLRDLLGFMPAPKAPSSASNSSRRGGSSKSSKE